MRLFVLAILTCQVVFISCVQLYSTLSCVLLRSDDYVIANREQRSNALFNVTDDGSLESNINFWLYTRQYPYGREISLKNQTSLKESGFDANSPTRIITHGLNGRGRDETCIGPMEAFLSKGEFNIIIMDWNAVQSINYFDVVSKVKPTALHLAEMINFLVEYGMNASTTVLIGHSFGAHVVGIAGYNSKAQINHIVGVDPAEPGFKNKGPGQRISREDATHVEIIHSNAGHCGMKEAVGHYDFYPNGGSQQPGCNRNSCSHGRSNEYYKESIVSLVGFYGRRCEDSKSIEKDKCTGEIAVMGGLTRTIATPGIYFVETHSQPPYAKHIDTILNCNNQ